MYMPVIAMQIRSVTLNIERYQLMKTSANEARYLANIIT